MQQRLGIEMPTRSGLGRAAFLLGRAYGAVPFTLSSLACSGIVFTMVLVCADVVMRFFFNSPIGGVNEIVSMLIVVCVFLQLGSTVSDDGMIRADFIMRHWRKERPALAEVADFVFLTLASLVLLVGTHWLWRESIAAYESSEYMGAVGAYQIPTWPFRLGAAIGCTAALIECVRSALRSLLRLGRQPHDAGISPLRRDLVPILLLLLAVAALLSAGLTLDLTPVQIGILMLAALLAGIAIGMPIAFALLCLSFLGIWLMRHDFFIASHSLGTTFSNAIAS
jgi:TRAP-type C4-dicarboxylate transport system permease small subunit